MKFFILILIIFYCSCSQQAGVVKSPAFCSDLRNEIKNNWKLTTDSSYYETNLQFLRRVDSIYKSCLINENNVISLFGQPNKTGHSFHRLELIYHIDKPCTSEHKYECSDFMIYFDEGDSVKGTMVITTGKPYRQK